MELEMTVEIKTIDFEPKRHTFGHVARRIGGDKPATRYQEATFDVQATENFHYKPLWEPEFWHYDTAKTKVIMEDWYKPLDPRQYYYATYNIARANMNQAVDRNFTFVEDKNLLGKIAPQTNEKLIRGLIPVRHLHWGSNMNMAEITQRGYGTAVTAPCIFSAGDHLGMAQIVSRIGLELDGQTGDGLDKAKDAWMNDAAWQGIRKLIEDTLVERDFFELYVAQVLGVNATIFEAIYNGMDDAWGEAALPISMLSEFMNDWGKEEARWSHSTIKIVAAESAQNKELVSSWAKKWIDRAQSALETYGSQMGIAELGKTYADKTRAIAKSLGLEV